MVIYLYATALFDADNDSYEALDQYKRSVEGMKRVAYPRAVARLAISGYYRDLRTLGTRAAGSSGPSLPLSCNGSASP